jgi:hypothetical protein
MERREGEREGEVRPAAPEDAPTGRTLSRRQALGRMSVVATAGAVAWVVPEIMTAKPAAGASLSITPRGGGGGGGGGDGPPGVATPPGVSTTPGQPTSTPDSGATTTLGTTSADAPADLPTGTLAFTGVDLERDAEIGAALIAGGWAMHHWASRTPKSADQAKGRTGAARSTDTPT